MIKIILIIISLFFFIPKVFAVTLYEALNQSYKNNPELNAERENIKISKEELKISKSKYLPSVTILGSKSQENTKKLTNSAGLDQSVNDVDPFTQSITIEQTLIDFGRSADFQKNKIGINLADVKLLKKEQDILLKAIEAFTGLILANEKFDINKSNLDLLERQVETDRARLERGQITLADLAQSEASLAGAEAKFIKSKNEIATSKLNYENIIGPISQPELLKKDYTIDLKLPENLNKAIKISKKNNPDLLIAKFEFQKSEKDVLIARSNLSPSATLSFENILRKPMFPTKSFSSFSREI